MTEQRSVTIEVTHEMVEAGIAAINKLREAELHVQKRESVEASWGDVLTAAYAAMELCRQRHEVYGAVLRDMDIPRSGQMT